MAKLHELLAVDSSLKGQADKARTDLVNTFDKKRHHFTEKTVTFRPLQEGAPALREDQLDLQTTVRKELSWLTGILSNALDVSYQISEANTAARADVVLEDETVILKAVPATTLLELEKRVNEIQQTVNAIPTLDPAKGFRPDEARGVGIFVARETFKTRTQKVTEPLVLAPATEKHPAQVQLIQRDIAIGHIHEQEWSALITVNEKAGMLERVEKLQRAVKRARARANEATVDTQKKIGATLLNYVFGA
jgi:hypothetical protein